MTNGRYGENQKAATCLQNAWLRTDVHFLLPTRGSLNTLVILLVDLVEVGPLQAGALEVGLVEVGLASYVW